MQIYASSEYWWWIRPNDWNTADSDAMYSENSSGPGDDPYGTPWFRIDVADKTQCNRITNNEQLWLQSASPGLGLACLAEHMLQPLHHRCIDDAIKRGWLVEGNDNCWSTIVKARYYWWLSATRPGSCNTHLGFSNFDWISLVISALYASIVYVVVFQRLIWVQSCQLHSPTDAWREEQSERVRVARGSGSNLTLVSNSLGRSCQVAFSVVAPASPGRRQEQR